MVEKVNKKTDRKKPITSIPIDKPKKSSEITRQDIWHVILQGYGSKGTDEDKRNCIAKITAYLKQEAGKVSAVSNYNILILFDTLTMIKADADKIYNAIQTFRDSKQLLLVLYSSGGDAGSAYLIGKLCREYSGEKFIISVPRHAKSAATIICCAADEIHMGSLSELGPIDPQIDDLPALGLKYSVEHIADLVTRYSSASDMFAKYLSLTLAPINLGYYERVAESAAQYAERLLLTHVASLPRPASEIAATLVYQYKDHSFVIDKSEAAQIFGKQNIKINTPEYQISNNIYKALDIISYYFRIMKHNFYHIGCLDSEPTIFKK